MNNSLKSQLSLGVDGSHYINMTTFTDYHNQSRTSINTIDNPYTDTLTSDTDKPKQKSIIKECMLTLCIMIGIFIFVFIGRHI